MTTKLEQLYSLRKNFSVIGLTGRTGSGCSVLGEMLSKEFSALENIRDPNKLEPSVFQKKFGIAYNFTKENWKKYKVIEYRKVLLLILLPELFDNHENTQLFDFYRYRLKDEPNETFILKIKTEIQEIITSNLRLVSKIKGLGVISEIKVEDKLKELNDIFWGAEFTKIANEIDAKLRENGFIERIMLLHHTANNFRRSGQPFKTEETNPENIYKIARIINRIIKATKQETKGECHIVLDSLRNSLEINFFKERYSAFYLIAVKNDRRRTRLIEMYPSIEEEKIDRLLEIDEAEYGSSDFQKGIFYAPDVQNCIQIADYHINNYLLKDDFNTESKECTFYSLDEQLMKLQGLIQQPGLITPEPTERVMQIAYTAKLNSGCISRQVGAVVTDDEFSTKAIGWNDVPKGALPCSLRNVKDISNPDLQFGFTQFELGKGLKETEQINIGELDREIDWESKNFYKYILEKYNNTTLPESQLVGRNCPYCFKSTYNAFSGEKNQVHTRSLHAEENAMMQISKYGGQGLKNGYLFTTASPCELCAKKAYQLGIRTIYFIDPYPGISRNHILKSMEDKDPEMILFSGAVGKAYHKLYEPFISQKDELALLTSFKLESPQKVKAKSLRNLLGDSLIGKDELKKKLDELLENDENIFDNFISVIEKGLKD